MYIPRRHQEKNSEEIFSFLRENSFAILVSVKDGLPLATHIPLLLDTNSFGDDVLTGHISRGNEQKFSLRDGVKVLCIFPGPHSYVSPRWYTQLNVPTWNYIAVHVYGTLRIMETHELRAALDKLVDTYEHHLPRPVKMDEIPEKTLRDDMRGIIGFEIRIEDLQAAYKLSQNRDEESYNNIIHELKEGDLSSQQVAAAMQDRSSQLFKDDPV